MDWEREGGREGGRERELTHTHTHTLKMYICLFLLQVVQQHIEIMTPSCILARFACMVRFPFASRVCVCVCACVCVQYNVKTPVPQCFVEIKNGGGTGRDKEGSRSEEAVFSSCSMNF